MNGFDDLDRPLWGAVKIGRAAGITDEDGNVDPQQVYYAAKKGYIDVTRVGRQLVSTRRRILHSLGAQTEKAAIKSG